MSIEKDRLTIERLRGMNGLGVSDYILLCESALRVVDHLEEELRKDRQLELFDRKEYI